MSPRRLVSTQRVVILMLVWCVLKAIHESAHAIASHLCGLRIQNAGVALILFSPIAFVDVGNTWVLPRRQRLIISAAGMIAELIIAAFAALLWSWIWPQTHPLLSSILHSVIIAAGVSTILFNANVLMRFDGYYMLSDLVNMPNLSLDAQTLLSDVSQRLIWSQRAVGFRRRYTGWRHVLLWVYALAAPLWRVVVSVGLITAASIMLGGWGVILSVVGVIVFFVLPLGRALTNFVQRIWRNPIAGVLAIGRISIAVALLVAAIGFVPIPGILRGSGTHIPMVMAEDQRGTIAAPCDGFIHQIHVRDGDRLHAGDAILTLRNDSLELRRRLLEIETRQLHLMIQQADAAACHQRR
ncbi:MAG: biotin/lipoyl-binding protein, partial [Planctomycetota bacterium]